MAAGHHNTPARVVDIFQGVFFPELSHSALLLTYLAQIAVQSYDDMNDVQMMTRWCGDREWWVVVSVFIHSPNEGFWACLKDLPPVNYELVQCISLPETTHFLLYLMV